MEPQQRKQPPHFTMQKRHSPVPTLPMSLDYSMPWKLTDTGSGVMQFSASSSAGNDAKLMLHQKRKLELVQAPLPPKQFISEEKITAHFNGLHISSDYVQGAPSSSDDSASGQAVGGDTEAPSTSSGKCFTNLTYEDYQDTARELEQKLKNAQRITMCEEIRKFHEDQQKVSYLPKALLHNYVERPCTALVLWQPPPLLELLQKKTDADGQQETKELDDYVELDVDDDEDDDFVDPDPYPELDDFIDNNNSSSLDYNYLRPDGMDEDL